MNQWIRTLMAAAVTLAMSALVLAIDARELAEDSAVVTYDSEVLATIEVRGQRFDLSDGRTARNATAASGLTALVQLVPGPVETPMPSAGASVPTPAGATTRPAGAATADDVPAPTAPVASVVPAPTPARVPLPAPTAEPSPTPTPVPPSPAVRGSQALSLIDYAWQERLPGWRIDFLPERPGLRAVTLSRERRIEVFVRADQRRWDIARVIAHELGHAVDLERNTAEDRRRWEQARGISEGSPWWPESGAADFLTGAGDFAECFATWQVASTTLSQLAGVCTEAQIELVAALS